MAPRVDAMNGHFGHWADAELQQLMKGMSNAGGR